MNSWLFPPKTKEVQFDEKWAFVGKKEKKCDPDNPADAEQGDNWDHVAYDSEHRLVLSVVPGKRTGENVKKLVEDFKKRTNGRQMNLITTDEYKSYKTAILDAYGEEVILSNSENHIHSEVLDKVPPKGLNYAVVHKIREEGKVVKVDFRIIFGTVKAVMEALANSSVSKKINTAFIERQNGTDRNRNARKIRKSYCFSKDWKIHEMVTYFTMYTYNFCWPVRTLRVKGCDGHWVAQTPALSAGFTDHVWTIEEWCKFPAVKLK